MTKQQSDNANKFKCFNYFLAICLVFGFTFTNVLAQTNTQNANSQTNQTSQIRNRQTTLEIKGRTLTNKLYQQKPPLL